MLLLNYGPNREVVARCSRTSQGRASKRPDHDAVYTFDLKIAQDRGLTFHQTGSFAVIPHDTVPIRSIGESFETSHIGDKSPIRYKICKSHRRYTLKHFDWNGRKPCATQGWKQHGETRCYFTVTKHKSLVLISKYKENQIN